jgi:5-methylcytosine-specific restriction endonuclease McrA
LARKEFSKSIKVAVIKRATVDGQVYCEECGCLTKGRFEIDHVRADGLLGEATLENAKLLCKPCHDEKTKADVAAIAQAKRREALHLGVRKKPSFVSRGFAKFTKAPKEPLKLPPRKPLFKDK